MDDQRAEHYERFIAQIEKRDPDLANELRGKFGSKEKARTERHPARAIAIPKLEAETAPAIPREDEFLQEREAETIVRQNARPVMVIRENRATKDFLGPASGVWADRVIAAQKALEQQPGLPVARYRMADRGGRDRNESPRRARVRPARPERLRVPNRSRWRTAVRPHRLPGRVRAGEIR
jgi:hypothetical protein